MILLWSIFFVSSVVHSYGMKSNQILDCRYALGLDELQDLIEAAAAKKGVTPFAVLRMLHKRMKTKEEMEENIMHSLDGVPDRPLVSNISPPMRTPPSSSGTPHTVPSEMPLEEDTKVVIPAAAPKQSYFPNRLSQVMKMDNFPIRLPPETKPDTLPDHPLVLNIPPPIRIPPLSNEISYNLPSEVPLEEDEDTKLVIIPVSPLAQKQKNFPNKPAVKPDNIPIRLPPEEKLDSLPDHPVVLNTPPPMRTLPLSNEISYALPSEVPLEEDEDTKIVIIPVAPTTPKQNNFLNKPTVKPDNFFNRLPPEMKPNINANILSPVMKSDDFTTKLPPKMNANNFPLRIPPDIKAENIPNRLPQEKNPDILPNKIPPAMSIDNFPMRFAPELKLNNFPMTPPPEMKPENYPNKLLVEMKSAILPIKIPPVIRPDIKSRNDVILAMDDTDLPAEKPNDALPTVFPLMSFIRNAHFKPPVGAVVRVHSGGLHREMIVSVSPLMSVLEALRQAEIKYQNVEKEMFRFTPSANQDCFLIAAVQNVFKNNETGWKVTVTDRNEQIAYDDFCLPDDVLIKPGTVISLSYVPF